MSVIEDCVQGIFGLPAMGREWQAAIVLQGPYVRHHAETVIRIFLERNPPNILLIVSTYLIPECEGIPERMLGEYENRVIRGDTGRLVYLFLQPPTKEQEPQFWENNFTNQSLQRLTSFAGLRYADQLGIKFAMKCRLDCFLGMNNICTYLLEEYNKFPLKEEKPSVISGRIIVGDLSKSQYESPWARLGYFHVNDFWFFGKTKDLMLYFDIRKGCSWRTEPETEIMAPETNFARQWMKEVGITITTSPQSDGLLELLAKYFIVVDSIDVEFNFLKVWHRNHQEYLDSGKDFLKHIQKIERDYWPVISRERWLDLVAANH